MKKAMKTKIRASYDWDLFLNGEKQQITQFECCGYHNFKLMFRDRVRNKKGIFAAIRREESNEVETITFQVWAPGPSPDWVTDSDIVVGRVIR